MKTPILLPLVGLVACGAPAGLDSAAPPIASFSAVLDPGRLALTFGSDRAARGLSPLAVEQDGVPGRGPSNTVELVTLSVGYDCAGGGPNSWGGPVTLNSFYTTRIADLAVQIGSVTPPSGFEPSPVTNDPPFRGLDNSRGLIRYRAGPGTTEDWCFLVAGAGPWSITGLVYGTPDGEPPSILFSSSPQVGSCMTSGGAVVSGGSGSVDFSLSDPGSPGYPPSGLADARCTLRMGAGGSTIVVVADIDCGSGRFDFTNLASGVYQLEVRATDRAGNSSTATRLFVVDAGAPIVSFIAPSAAAPSLPFGQNGTMLIDPDVSAQPPSLACTIDAAPVACGPTSYAAAGLAVGPHTVVVRATDCAGNRAPDASLDFTVVP